MRFVYLTLIIFCVSFKSFVLSAHDSFANLVENLIPSVVSIASKTIIKEQLRQPIPQFPEGSPFDDFFKDFFDREQRTPSLRRPLIGLGSGFIIHESGIVVTNNHVIEGADEITIIMADKNEFTAELMGRDPKADLAVLKFYPKDKELVKISWGDSDVTRVGDQTIAIGNPLGLGGSVTAGIVSAIARDIGSGPYVKFIQTDASINRGNSGGPLFNINGEVIGINTAIISQTGGSIGLGFAIPSNSARKIITQLKDFGRTKRGWLGVQITVVTKEISERLRLSDEKGAYVSNLNPQGPAKKAGIEVEDIILKFNNTEILKMTDLPRIVAESDVGTLALVEVWRKNKKITFEVELGELQEKTYVKRTNKDNEINEIEITDPRLSVSSTKDDEGVKVVKINEESNLLVGDIIKEVNRESVTTVDSFIKLVSDIKKTGRNSLLLRIMRDEVYLWVTVKFKY